jgi:hypothetical protein
VHVQRERKVCKFWLQLVSLAKNTGFTPRELNYLRRTVLGNLTIIQEAWHEHCG